MRVNLKGDEEMRQMVREKFLSKEWWLILWGRTKGGDFIIDVENTYYVGEQSADFELLMGGFIPSLWAVAFAKKKHMNAKQLVEIMNRNGMDTMTPELIGDRDIIGPGITEDTMSEFANWMLEGQK